MILSRTFSLALMALLALAGVSRAAEPETEPLPKAKAALEKMESILLDVREKKEWDRGHIDGAILLSLSTMQEDKTGDSLKKLPKDKVIYTHCVKGIRAETAAEMLRKRGYQAKALKEGYSQLIEAGLPKAPVDPKADAARDE